MVTLLARSFFDVNTDSFGVVCPVHQLKYHIIVVRGDCSACNNDEEKNRDRRRMTVMCSLNDQTIFF